MPGSQHFLQDLVSTVVYPYPLACSPSSLQTVFLKTLHPDMDATLHNHSQKDGGEMVYRSSKSEGEDSCGNTSSFPGGFWTLLVAKLPGLLLFRLPSLPWEWYFSLCHTSQQELCCLFSVSFCSVCCYCLVTATSPSVLVRLLHNSPSSADQASNQQPLRQH